MAVEKLYEQLLKHKVTPIEANHPLKFKKEKENYKERKNRNLMILNPKNLSVYLSESYIYNSRTLSLI